MAKRLAPSGPPPITFAAVYGGVLGRWPQLRDEPAWEVAVRPIVELYSEEEREAVLAAWHLAGRDAAAVLLRELRGPLIPFRYVRMAPGCLAEKITMLVLRVPHVFRRGEPWTLIKDPELARRCLLESARSDRYVPAFEMRIDPP